MTIRPAMLALALAASPAIAQTTTTDLQAIAACAEAAPDAARAAQCIEPALAPCDAVLYETPAVARLCYDRARAAFDTGITRERQRLAGLTARQGASRSVTVNTRYDMLRALLDCDRNEALSTIGETPPGDVARAKARCVASVSAVTWLKLRLALRQ